MNRFSKLTLVLLAISVCLSGPAFAGDHQAEDHQGMFFQAGALGSMDLGIGDNRRNFDIGPGAFVGLGYSWGLMGVRSHFRYAQMDYRGGAPGGSDVFGGGLELKLSPLANGDSIFQPYVVAGVGANYLEFNNGIGGQQGDWGFVGNGGVGFDLFIIDGLAFTMETNIRPSVFYQDPKTMQNNSYDVYFYDFMGGLTYYFGGHAKEKPTPAPTPTPVVEKAAPVVAPVVAPVAAKPHQRVELKGEINFKTNSAEIHPNSYPVLDDAVAKMKAHPEIELVSIEGYTDSDGTEAYNMGLSKRRADAVKKYLEGKGIAANRMTTKGFGESNPIAPNTTAAGKAKNRRIEFYAEKIKQ